MNSDEKLDSLMEHAAATRAWQTSVNEKLEAIPDLTKRVGSLEGSRSFALGAAKVAGIVAGGAVAVLTLAVKAVKALGQ